MAISHLSKVLTPQEHVAPVDESLVYKSLLYKQQQYDQGVQAIQTHYDQVGNYDILHPEHRKYYEEKLQNMTNEVNKMGGMNFADRAAVYKTDSIINEISNDSRIRTAIDDTRKIRDGWKQLQAWKNDPKKFAGMYNPANEWYFNKEISDYLNTTGDEAKYNGSGPIPYTSDDKLHKFLKDTRDSYMKNNYIEHVTSDGRVVRETSFDPVIISRIAQQEIQKDPALATQLGINAAYRGSSIKNEQSFRNVYYTAAKNEADVLAKQIDKFEKDRKATLAVIPKDKLKEYTSSYDENIQHLKGELEKKRSYAESINTVPLNQLVQSSYMDGYVNELAQAYQGKNKSYKTDQAYWNAQNLNLQITKEKNDQSRWEFEMQQEMLNKQRDYDLALRKQEQEENKLGLSTDANGNKVPVQPNFMVLPKCWTVEMPN